MYISVMMADSSCKSIQKSVGFNDSSGLAVVPLGGGEFGDVDGDVLSVCIIRRCRRLSSWR